MYAYPHAYYRTLNQLAEDIAKAINGQYTAVVCYERLAALAPSEEEKNIILEIRNDEIRHLQEFTEIYRTMTGRQPKPVMTETCPTHYKEGLMAAFKDEQETVDFYLDIADRSNQYRIKEIFRRAAADEQNHAVWFLSFLTAR